jgi:hypothetical protein
MKCDAVVITVRQNVGLFSDVSRAMDLLLIAGVPAVTALLNFSRPDPLKLHSLVLLKAGMKLLSTLDTRLKSRIASLSSVLLKKGRNSGIWNKIHRNKSSRRMEGQK